MSEEALLRAVEFYGEKIVTLLTTLIKKEQQGFRVRTNRGSMRAMDKTEWEEGKRLLRDRLDAAEDGMTARELKEFMQRAGHERFAKNLERSNLRRKSPLREMVNARQIILEQKTIRHVARYWSRHMYLRRHAALPDDWQQELVMEAIDKLSSDSSSELKKGK